MTTGVQSAPALPSEALRQHRLERFGLPAAIARLVSGLAFGEPRADLIVVTVAEASTLVDGGRQ